MINPRLRKLIRYIPQRPYVDFESRKKILKAIYYAARQSCTPDGSRKIQITGSKPENGNRSLMLKNEFENSYFKLWEDKEKGHIGMMDKKNLVSGQEEFDLLWVQDYINFSKHTQEELDTLEMDVLGDIYLNIGLHFTEKRKIKIINVQIIEDPDQPGEYKLDIPNMQMVE